MGTYPVQAWTTLRACFASLAATPLLLHLSVLHALCSPCVPCFPPAHPMLTTPLPVRVDASSSLYRWRVFR